MSAHYVKAYVKRGKNDAADAEAMAIKTKEQQAVLVMHRARDLLCDSGPN